jgi:hypothetical protein
VQDLFPQFGVIADFVDLRIGERKTRRFCAIVVAGDAIFVDKLPLWDRFGGLPEERRGTDDEK